MDCGPFYPISARRQRQVGAVADFAMGAKKAPGKVVSQGGIGHDTFPGAIGRSTIATALGPYVARSWL